MRYIHKARLIVTIMFLTTLLWDCKKEIKLSSENTIKTFMLKRWDITTQSLPQGATPPQNYELGVKQLKDYINARYTYLDGIFNSW